MLENPYFAASSSLPDDPGVYRGEGRIEEAEDGRSISIWWESTLDEALSAQLRLVEKLGTIKQIRYVQFLYILFSGILIVSAWVLWWLDERLWVYLIIGAFVMLLSAALKPRGFRRSIRKVVIKMRGTEGTLETKAEIDPYGMHIASEDMEVIYYWRGIKEIELTEHGVTFLRERDGLIHVPMRVFSDLNSFERFISLSRHYSKSSLSSDI